MRDRLRRLVILACLAAPAVAAGQAAPTVVADYHNTPDRNGLYTVPGLTSTVAATAMLDTSFSGAVTGNLYAQPLYWRGATAKHGHVLVATESNQVYALDSVKGTVVWHTALGPKVANSQLPCGNIDPAGVTGTPVIDPATGTLYVAAMVDRPAGPQQLVYALSVHTGAILAGWPINVRAAAAALGITFAPAVQNQRSALAFVEGKLYVAYGGHDGDCGSYHGWVVGFDPTAPKLFGAWATRAHGGGIWAPGGPAVKGEKLFVATGNTMGASTWSDGEAVYHLPLDLARPTATADYFAPTDWQTLDNEDLDLGGTGPLPINVPVNGTVAMLLLALGKDGNAYLLDRLALGGIGGQLAAVNVSSDEIRTAAAAYPLASGMIVAFQGAGTSCPSGEGQGLTALQIAAPPNAGITTAWCAALNGGGAPIVTTSDGTHDPIVWVTGAEGDNLLHGFDALTGSVVFAGGGSAGQMSNLRHFGTILAAEGRLYIGADNRVYAWSFTGP